MVHRLGIILLALCFAAMPHRMSISEDCECSAPNKLVSVVGEDNADSRSCCSIEIEENEPQDSPIDDHDGEPCDGCDCFMSCCGISVTLAALTNGIKSVAPKLETEHAGLSPQEVCGSPHVSRLKRPPRLLTITA